MAKAIEKGATYLDKLCHKFYDEPKGHGERTGYVCRLCGGPLETYYCEERLYLVKCADCGTLALVKTVNPEVSASVTLARPTLTPPKDSTPVQHGRWVKPVPGDGENYCSVCHAVQPWFYGYGYYDSDYCPNCGACMDAKEALKDGSTTD